MSGQPADIPSQPAIRLARLDDATAVAALVTELGYPGDTVETIRGRLATWERTGNTTVLVAEQSERLVGVVALTVVPFFEREGNWGRVVALVVARECRGNGIGRLLLEAAEKTALDQGCLIMELTSARRRSGALAFYHTVGYQDWCQRSARFVKDLAPGASTHSYATGADAAAGPPRFQGNPA
jgi:GNAT superfamily N-acetyltransferase